MNQSNLVRFRKRAADRMLQFVCDGQFQQHDSFNVAKNKAKQKAEEKKVK